MRGFEKPKKINKADKVFSDHDQLNNINRRIGLLTIYREQIRTDKTEREYCDQKLSELFDQKRQIID